MSRLARWTVAVAAVLLVTAALWTMRREPATPVVGRAPAPTVAEAARADATRETPTRAPEAVEPHASVKVDEPSGDVPLQFVVTTVGDDPLPIPNAVVNVRLRDGTSMKVLMGPDGTSRLSAPVDTFEGCEATVSASGAAPISTLLHVDPSGDVRLTLDRDLALTGRVLDGRTGWPIAGARIEACQQKATTNDDGEFLVAAGTWSDKPVFGDVYAPGRVGLRFKHDARSGPLTLWLDPAGCVRGVVRTKDGVPVANASVSAHGETDESSESPYAKSDAAGAFTLDGLAFGVPHRLHAWTKELSGVVVEGVVSTEASPAIERDVVLGVGASLTVVVKDATGAVVPDAAVSAQRGETYEVGRGRTGADGSVVFEPVVPGPVSLTVWSDRFAETSVDLDVAPDEAKRIEVRVRPGIPIDGVVVDDEGAPVGGTEVGFLAPKEFQKWGQCGVTRPGPFLVVTTAADGTFHAVVPRRVGLEFELKAPGHVESAAAAVTSDDLRFLSRRRVNAVLPDAAPLRLVLPRAAMFLFEVRLPSGEYRNGVNVWAHDAAGVEVFGGTVWENRWFVAPCTARRATFEVGGFLPATRDLRPGVEGGGDLGVIALDRGVPLRGRIVGDDGAPVRYATISVSRPDTSRTWKAKGRADGTFEVTGIPDGPVVMEVGAPTHVRARRAVAAGGRVDPLVVTLDRGVTLVVRVLDAAGCAAPCDAIAVVAADGAPTVAALERTTSGRWAGRLPAGRWRLVAARGDAKSEQTIDVADGAPAVFTIRLSR